MFRAPRCPCGFAPKSGARHWGQPALSVTKGRNSLVAHVLGTVCCHPPDQQCPSSVIRDDGHPVPTAPLGCGRYVVPGITRSFYGVPASNSPPPQSPGASPYLGLCLSRRGAEPAGDLRQAHLLSRVRVYLCRQGPPDRERQAPGPSAFEDPSQPWTIWYLAKIASARLNALSIACSGAMPLFITSNSAMLKTCSALTSAIAGL
jgi:hypothetical protein